MTDAGRGSAYETGVVSIIVPCFDVALFVDECLESAVAQSYESIEIIAVDDGSTDPTGELLRTWARRDTRIVVIAQAHAGLGAARNRGIAAAVGEFLFFLDADDLIPMDAIDRLVQTMTGTGSDFASGVAERFDGRRRWRSALYGSDFDVDHRRTHLRERPDLVRDHIACSKLFRRSFWDEAVGRFPEGVLFEDIALVSKAHWHAQHVDLVATPTYRWRVPDTGRPSITQNRLSPGAIRARFDALSELDRFFSAEATPEIWTRHGVKVLTVDVPMYLREVARSGSDAALSELDVAGASFIEAMSPAVLPELPRHLRHVVRCLGNGRGETVRMIGLLDAPRRRREVGLFEALRSVPWRDRAPLLGADIERAIAGIRRRLSGVSVSRVNDG